MSKKPLGYDRTRSTNSSDYWQDKPEKLSMAGIGTSLPKRKCCKCKQHKVTAGSTYIDGNRSLFLCKDCKEAKEAKEK